MSFRIDRLGHLGDGIAETADGPVFVPGVLPGEEVEGQRDGAALLAPRILTPSTDRVRPPCAHARACGGCQLQHASDGFLARWRQSVVATALAAHGLAATPLPQAISPPKSRRRATFAGRRTKAGALVGFHRAQSDQIVEVPGCQVLHPDLVAALPALGELTRIAASRQDVLALSVTRTIDGLDVSVGGGSPPDAERRQALAGLAGRSAWARLSWSGETLAQNAAPRVRFGRPDVAIPAGAFLQATEAGEAALVADVTEILTGAQRIADLFAGCGTFALRLAERASVHAVEGDAAMVAALLGGARHAPGLHPVTAQTRDLFRAPLDHGDLAGFDGAVIDPPRAGAEAQARALAASRVPRLAYVSCNPVTFARDARILVDGGFRLDRLRVVDQFRWSHHTELVAGLSRPAALR